MFGAKSSESAAHMHLLNLHEDDQLTETIIYVLRDGITRVGTVAYTYTGRGYDVFYLIGFDSVSHAEMSHWEGFFREAWFVHRMVRLTQARRKWTN